MVQQPAAVQRWEQQAWQQPAAAVPDWAAHLPPAVQLPQAAAFQPQQPQSFQPAQPPWMRKVASGNALAQAGSKQSSGSGAWGGGGGKGGGGAGYRSTTPGFYAGACVGGWEAGGLGATAYLISAHAMQTLQLTRPGPSLAHPIPGPSHPPHPTCIQRATRTTSRTAVPSASARCQLCCAIAVLLCFLAAAAPSTSARWFLPLLCCCCCCCCSLQSPLARLPTCGALSAADPPRAAARG